MGTGNQVSTIQSPFCALAQIATPTPSDSVFSVFHLKPLPHMSHVPRILMLQPCLLHYVLLNALTTTICSQKLCHEGLVSVVLLFVGCSSCIYFFLFFFLPMFTYQPILLLSYNCPVVINSLYV